MKTGDVLKDGLGRSYQVGPLLGRGLWGKSFLARASDGNSEFVLKIPLASSDFKPDQGVGDNVIGGCIEACKEQARLLETGAFTFLAPLHARGAGEAPVLILPRFTSTLDRRISQGTPLADVVQILLQVGAHLRSLADDHGPHGNLRPTNILINDRGEALLCDLSTPAWRKVAARLLAASPDPNRYLPPEIAKGTEILDSSVDTYAMAMILYRAVMTPREGDSDGRAAVRLPAAGLDKQGLAELKTKTIERLKHEDSNPRFHTRMADRLAALLNRALSETAAPSPPYRFRQLDEFLPRLEELLALIRPEVSSAGRLMLNRPPGSETFQTDEDVLFTANVGVSPGVESADEIAVGIALFDLETDQRVRTVEAGYSADRRPAGKFHFEFKLRGVDPGRFKVRVAFAIRDSGQPPATAETRFEVRAAAGWTPKPRSTDGTIPFGPRDGEETTTRPSDTDSGAMRPTPIAPTEPETAAWRKPEAITTPIPIATSAVAAEEEEPATVARPPSAEPVSPRVIAVEEKVAEALDLLEEESPISRDMGDETLSHLLTEGPPPMPIPVARPASVVPRPVTSSGNTWPGEEPPRAPAEHTDPAVSLSTQVPQTTAKDLLGANSWADLPLPGPGNDPSPPVIDDAPGPESPSALKKALDTLKGDPYLLFITAAGVIILILLVVLLLLPST